MNSSYPTRQEIWLRRLSNKSKNRLANFVASASRTDQLSLSGIRIAFDLAGPTQKSKQLFFFLPEEVPKIARSNGIRTLTGISFESPPQISASPGSQPIAARRIPQKPEFFADTSRHL